MTHVSITALRMQSQYCPVQRVYWGGRDYRGGSGGGGGGGADTKQREKPIPDVGGSHLLWIQVTLPPSHSWRSMSAFSRNSAKRHSVVSKLSDFPSPTLAFWWFQPLSYLSHFLFPFCLNFKSNQPYLFLNTSLQLINQTPKRDLWVFLVFSIVHWAVEDTK